MDPQLARLLSSLTLSAKSNGIVNAADGNSTGISVHRTLRDTLEPRLVPSDESEHEPPQLDWSSSVPPAPQDSPQDSPDQKHREGVGAQPVPIPATLSVSHDNNGNGGNLNELMAPSAPPAALPSPTSSLRSPHIRPPTSDISPYLSRAVEIPKTAKELQARSLLESVAIESEKMAHVMSATSMANNPGLAPMSFLQPGPAPLMVHDSSADLGILYSSHDGGRNLASVNGFRPGPHMGDTGQIFQDFQARSRTSHALHRHPIHNVTGSVNLNQNQQNLVATMNGLRSPGLSVQYQMPPQRFAQQIPSYPHMHTAGGPYYPPLNNTQFGSPPPMNLPHNTLLQSNGRPLPLPQAGAHPFPGVHGMHIPGPIPTAPSETAQQTAATLLTILNGPRQPITVPGPVPQY